MAKIRVRIDAILDTDDGRTKDKLVDGLEVLKSKMKRANAVETSSIVVERCYHDETPSKPCEVLSSWEKQ
jgi:hypothetical protein|tara:strand:- start:3599 stop:3808 length:210 start_codon:yes stop_codon:yes gene_type:complete